jgi:hypothetical protein
MTVKPEVSGSAMSRRYRPPDAGCTSCREATVVLASTAAEIRGAVPIGLGHPVWTMPHEPLTVISG